MKPAWHARVAERAGQALAPIAPTRIPIEPSASVPYVGVMSSPPPDPSIHIETLHNPQLYTSQQVDRALVVARALNRGRLVLAERPGRMLG
jgi:hypothetical protein